LPRPVGPRVLRPRLLASLAPPPLAGRVTGENPAVYHPDLLADPSGIHPALIAVILRINAAMQGEPQQRHFRVHLSPGIQQLPVDLLALVVLPGLTQRGVGEGLEPVDIALGLVEVQNDAAPGSEGAVDCPDVPGDAVRRGHRLVIRAVVIKPVLRPDAGFVANPAPLVLLLLKLMLVDNAAGMLAQVPGLAGPVRFPLEAEVAVLAAPLQVLLFPTVSARHVQPEEVRRLIGSRFDLALAFGLGRTPPDRLRE